MFLRDRAGGRTPQDTGANCAPKTGYQQKIAGKRQAKKARADSADEEQRAGVIGENQDMLGFFR